eukprot:g22270.t1
MTISQDTETVLKKVEEELLSSIGPDGLLTRQRCVTILTTVGFTPQEANTLLEESGTLAPHVSTVQGREEISVRGLYDLLRAKTATPEAASPRHEAGREGLRRQSIPQGMDDRSVQAQASTSSPGGAICTTSPGNLMPASAQAEAGTSPSAPASSSSSGPGPVASGRWRNRALLGSQASASSSSGAICTASPIGNPVPPPASAQVPQLRSAHGARVAMFSARFDGGETEQRFRAIHRILVGNGYDVLMVSDELQIARLATFAPPTKKRNEAGLACSTEAGLASTRRTDLDETELRRPMGATR